MEHRAQHNQGLYFLWVACHQCCHIWAKLSIWNTQTLTQKHPKGVCSVIAEEHRLFLSQRARLAERDWGSPPPSDPPWHQLYFPKILVTRWWCHKQHDLIVKKNSHHHEGQLGPAAFYVPASFESVLSLMWFLNDGYSKNTRRVCDFCPTGLTSMTASGCSVWFLRDARSGGRDRARSAHHVGGSL